MKNLFQGKTCLLLAIAVFFLSAFGYSDKSLCELLPGEWKVTSYVSDGDEVMGELNEFSMRFDDSGGCGGDLNWTLADDWEETDIDGEYSIDEAARKITLTIEGEQAVFELALDNHNLKMSGNLDGEDVVIKAKRK